MLVRLELFHLQGDLSVHRRSSSVLAFTTLGQCLYHMTHLDTEGKLMT